MIGEVLRAGDIVHLAPRARERDGPASFSPSPERPPMHPQPRRRTSTPIANRARKSFRSRPGVETLEGRALLTMTVTPIDFPATVSTAPVAMNGVLYFSASDTA